MPGLHNWIINDAIDISIKNKEEEKPTKKIKFKNKKKEIKFKK
jgi:hypothetical protein